MMSLLKKMRLLKKIKTICPAGEISLLWFRAERAGEKFGRNFRMVAVIYMSALAPYSSHAAGLRPATLEPTRIAWYSDPQTLYVRPGNAGELLFNDKATSPPSHLHPWQDEYCNAAWLDLDSPEYTVRITSRFDAESTQSYWARLEGWMTSMAYAGAAPFWIIDDDFIMRYSADPALADALTSQVISFTNSDLPQPAVVLKPNRWTSDSEALLRHLRQGDFAGLIGAHITSDNKASLPRAGWDFIVIDPKIVPDHYRGQAAAAWARSRYGQIPVLLAPEKFDFLRDVIWIGCGAAGIWYPALPNAPAANKAAAINLRASTTFLNRFPNTWLALSPLPAHPAFSFTLEDPGRAWAAVVPATAEPVTISTPADLAGKLVATGWYNPATDQTIIQPLTRLSSVISVQRPDANLWIYTLSVAPAQAENATSIAPIRDWPR